MGLMIISIGSMHPIRGGGQDSDTTDTPLLDHSNDGLIIDMITGVLAHPI